MSSSRSTLGGWTPPAAAVRDKPTPTSVPWSYLQIITLAFDAAASHCRKGPLDKSRSVFKPEHANVLTQMPSIIPVDHRFEHATLCRKAYFRCTITNQLICGSERPLASSLPVYLAARKKCEDLYNRVRVSKKQRPFKFRKLPEIECDDSAALENTVNRAHIHFKNQSRRDFSRFCEIYDATTNTKDLADHAGACVMHYLLIMTLPFMFNLGLEQAHTQRHIEAFIDELAPDEGTGTEVD